MTVHLNHPPISYFSVPKCGTTSMNRFFFEVENGIAFPQAKDAGHPSVRGQRFIHDVYPSLPFQEASAASPDGALRFCIVRDPLSRVASCYANKVLQRRMLDEPEIARLARARGLSTEPDFTTFVERLDEYAPLTGEFSGHLLPLAYFLGGDPAYFDRIFSLQDLPTVVAVVAQHLGRPVPTLEHMKSSSSSDVLDSLPNRQREALLERYAEDVRLYRPWF